MQVALVWTSPLHAQLGVDPPRLIVPPLFAPTRRASTYRGGKRPGAGPKRRGCSYSVGWSSEPVYLSEVAKGTEREAKTVIPVRPWRTEYHQGSSRSGGSIAPPAVNAPMLDDNPGRLNVFIRLDRPLGEPTWTLATAKTLGLEYSLRPPAARPGLERGDRDLRGITAPGSPIPRARGIGESKVKLPILTNLPTKLPVSRMALRSRESLPLRDFRGADYDNEES